MKTPSDCVDKYKLIFSNLRITFTHSSTVPNTNHHLKKPFIY